MQLGEGLVPDFDSPLLHDLSFELCLVLQERGDARLLRGNGSHERKGIVLFALIHGLVHI